MPRFSGKHLIEEKAYVGHAAGNHLLPSGSSLFIGLGLFTSQLRHHNFRVVQRGDHVAVTREVGAKEGGAAAACAAGVREDDQWITSSLSCSISNSHLRSCCAAWRDGETILGLWSKILAAMFRVGGIPDLAREQAAAARVMCLDGAYADREWAAGKGIVSGRRLIRNHLLLFTDDRIVVSLKALHKLVEICPFYIVR